MKRIMSYLIVFFCFVLNVFLMFSCGSKVIKPGYERCITNCKDPDWVPAPDKKSTKEQKAFVGQSFNHSTERMAIDYAEINAREKVLDNLWGTYGRRKLQQALANAGASTADIISDAVVQEVQTEWKSRGVVTADIVANHVQKWERYDQLGGIDYYYTAKVLFLVDRNLVKQFLTDLLQQQKEQKIEEIDKRNIDRALDLIEKMDQNDFNDW